MNFPRSMVTEPSSSVSEARLLAASTISSSARDYRTARLFTPTAHARARRFYERRGWTAVAEAWTAVAEAWNEDLGLTLT